MRRRGHRVIQWATGSVGRHAIPAIAEDPALELVGVWVHSPAKVGRDAGELAGIGPLGVRATNDVDALLRLDADCVLYAPLLANLDEMVRILESGKNVVTPTGFVYLKDPVVLARLGDACRRGGVSFHGTGIHPGLVGDRLPLVLSALCRRIDRIRVFEICDFSHLSESPEMVFGQLGFGMPAEEARRNPPALLGVMSRIFGESMQMIAAGLGFEIDELRTTHEFAVATDEVRGHAGVIPKGHVAGWHFEYVAIARGKRAIEFQTYWRMSEQIEPRWPYDAVLEYVVEIDGEPPLRCSLGSIAKGDSPEFGLLWTAMNCVNAIAPVCEVAPGIRTSLDLPLLTARGRMNL